MAKRLVTAMGWENDLLAAVKDLMQYTLIQPDPKKDREFEMIFCRILAAIRAAEMEKRQNVN